MYMVQPKSAAPPGVKNPDSMISPPAEVIQKPNEFKRGKATSGAPICSGSTKFAKPQTTGVENSSSITVPCMVNSWLYCSLERNWRPGVKSSARISSAIKPPRKKKPKDMMMYMMPSCLWSVVVSIIQAFEPVFSLPDGSGRVG